MKNFIKNLFEVGYFDHPGDYRTYFLKLFGITIYKTDVYRYELLLEIPIRVKIFNKIFNYLR